MQNAGAAESNLRFVFLSSAQLLVFCCLETTKYLPQTSFSLFVVMLLIFIAHRSFSCKIVPEEYRNLFLTDKHLDALTLTHDGVSAAAGQYHV